MEEAENIEEPQNNTNYHDGVQDIFDGALHGNKAIDQPEQHAYDDQNNYDVNQGHGGAFLTQEFRLLSELFGRWVELSPHCCNAHPTTPNAGIASVLRCAEMKGGQPPGSRGCPVGVEAEVALRIYGAVLKVQTRLAASELPEASFTPFAPPTIVAMYVVLALRLTGAEAFAGVNVAFFVAGSYVTTPVTAAPVVELIMVKVPPSIVVPSIALLNVTVIGTLVATVVRSAGLGTAVGSTVSVAVPVLNVKL